MSCNIPALPQDTEASANSGSQLLSQMHITSCSTNSQSVTGSLNESVLGGLLESGSLSLAEASSSTVGCQDVTALLNNFSQAVNDVSCTVNNMSNGQNITVDADSTLNVQATGAYSSVIYPSSCPNGPTVSQTSTITIHSLSNLDTNDKETLTTQIQGHLQNLVSGMTTQNTGFGATPQGSQLLSSMQQKITNQNIQEALNSALNTVDINVQSDKTINFIASGDHSTVMMPCEISQASIINLQVSTILANIYSSVFSGDLTQYLTEKQQYDYNQTSSGQPNALLSSLKSNWKAYLAIVAIIIVIGIVAYFFIKSGGVKDVTSAVAKNPEVLAFRRRRRY